MPAARAALKATATPAIADWRTINDQIVKELLNSFVID